MVGMMVRGDGASRRGNGLERSFEVNIVKDSGREMCEAVDSAPGGKGGNATA